MTERATNNPDFLNHNPDAIQDSDAAYDVGPVGHVDRTRARSYRKGVELAIEAALAVEGVTSVDGNSYIGDQPANYIFDKKMSSEGQKAGFIEEDYDIATGIAEGHPDKLTTEEGRSQLAEHYARLAARADEIASMKEDSAIHSDTYIIPGNLKDD